MVRGIVRAAAYLPHGTDGHRRVGAVDEDAFTFAATALERAVLRDRPDDRPQTVTTVGASGTFDPSALAVILGAPVRLSAIEEEEPAVDHALDAALRGDGPHWVVAVARDRPGAPGTSVGSPGEGAIAVLIDDGASGKPPPLPREGRDGGRSPLARLFAMNRPEGETISWLGDWGADPTAGPRARPSPVSLREAPPFTVSQGAYVPPPRYEESRPSRWSFTADQCRSCGARTFPSRGWCRRCGATDGLVPSRLPLDGATVLAVTWIGSGGQPTEFDLQVEIAGSYGVVLAEVAPEVRVTLMVAEGAPDEVRVGSKVDSTLRRLYPIEGSWRYGRKAIPAAGPPPDVGRHRAKPD